MMRRNAMQRGEKIRKESTLMIIPGRRIFDGIRRLVWNDLRRLSCTQVAKSLRQVSCRLLGVQLVHVGRGAVGYGRIIRSAIGHFLATSFGRFWNDNRNVRLDWLLHIQTFSGHIQALGGGGVVVGFHGIRGLALGEDFWETRCRGRGKNGRCFRILRVVWNFKIIFLNIISRKQILVVLISSKSCKSCLKMDLPVVWVSLVISPLDPWPDYLILIKYKRTAKKANLANLFLCTIYIETQHFPWRFSNLNNCRFFCSKYT